MGGVIWLVSSQWITTLAYNIITVEHLVYFILLKHCVHFNYEHNFPHKGVERGSGHYSF